VITTLLLVALTCYVVVGLLFVACAVVMAGRSPHPRPLPVRVATTPQSTTRPRT
jgi:hypothetical protein